MTVVTAATDAFAQAHRRTEALIGARLFTVLQPVSRADTPHTMVRTYSSRPTEFPIGGTKTFDPPPDWYLSCAIHARPFLGPDLTALRAAFPDHGLIESLGCGAFINVPVVRAGRMWAILCLLDAESAYDEDSLVLATRIAEDVAAHHDQDYGVDA